MIGKSGVDMSLDVMEKLPGGYYVKKVGDGFVLRRLEPERGLLIDCETYGSYGEAYEGYVEAFALELVLEAEGTMAGNVEEALEEAKRLVQANAEEYFAAEGRKG